jgi:hypothetical protein
MRTRSHAGVEEFAVASVDHPGVVGGNPYCNPLRHVDRLQTFTNANVGYAACCIASGDAVKHKRWEK